MRSSPCARAGVRSEVEEWQVDRRSAQQIMSVEQILHRHVGVIGRHLLVDRGQDIGPQLLFDRRDGLAWSGVGCRLPNDIAGGLFDEFVQPFPRDGREPEILCDGGEPWWLTEEATEAPETLPRRVGGRNVARFRGPNALRGEGPSPALSFGALGTDKGGRHGAAGRDHETENDPP